MKRPRPGSVTHGGGTDALPWAVLDALSIETLRTEWTKVFYRPPPLGLKRDLLRRGIAFAWQAAREGGLTTRVTRCLRTESSGSVAIGRSRALKPGTRLARTWQGDTHHVLVVDDGVEYRGQPYPSLSAVARAITGTRWSGPRFFGIARGAHG